MKKNYGEEDFKISSYYKKDYSSLIHGSRLFGSQSVMDWRLQCCFSVGERLRWKASRLQVICFCRGGDSAYVSLLIAYGIGAGSFYKNKHIKAKQRVKKYLRDLSRIEKINNKKEIN